VTNCCLLDYVRQNFNQLLGFPGDCIASYQFYITDHYQAAVDNLDVNEIAQDLVDKCETRRATFGHFIKH
jgi:hypothetical protein